MQKILVLDFGGQYAHLIARRFRSLGYYSEIALPDIKVKDIKDTAGIVLSGSPYSVYDKNAPGFNNEILSLNIPILGLCYGHQLLIQHYGGKVKKAQVGEFGFALLNKVNQSDIFNNIDFPTQIWMSHSDEVISIPDGFRVIGNTSDCKYAALENSTLKRYSLQFHAEVKDTKDGNIILDNFAKICGMQKNWDTTQVFKTIKERVIKEAGDKNVILFLSGGVDSTVTFSLLVNALGKNRVKGLYINNGFMRKNETESIVYRYKNANLDNFIVEDAEDIFLNAVNKTIDPQIKRKIIGETFLLIKNIVLKKLNLNEEEWLLAQGTLYPDIIESGGSKYADVIKTHHNRVEGIKDLLEKGLIIEPLKDLYKDEVRLLGKQLNLPDELINRHPFPGPGISINCICSNGVLDDEKNFNLIEEKIKNLNLSNYLKKGKYQLQLLPVKSVGVQGDFRTYNHPLLIKLNDFYKDFIGWDKFEELSSYIINTVKEINRVVLSMFIKNECKLNEGYCDKARLDMIREVDDIVLNELKSSNYYNKIFQELTISLPYASNKNKCSIVLRPVVSEDVMTARFAPIDIKLLKIISDKIFRLDFVDALFYDISNKPPATFGWE